VLVVLLATAGAAAEVQFIPTVHLDLVHTQNARYAGRRAPDTVANLGTVLALAVTRPATTFRLSYQPGATFHQKFSDFNNVSHRLETTVSHELSRTSSLDFRFGGFSSERQGFRVEDPQAPVTFVPRSRIQSYSATLAGSIKGGARSSWSWHTGSTLNRYGAAALRDATSYDAGFGWMREVSKTTSLGIDYGFQTISLTSLDANRIHNLGLAGSSRLGRTVGATYGLGVFRAETGSQTPTNLSLRLGLSKIVDRGISFLIGLNQNASAGGGLSAATRDRGAYMRWSFRPTLRISAGIALAWWDRSALGSSGSGDQTLVSRESLTWAPGKRRVAYSVFHTYSDQSLANRLLAKELDTNFHQYGVSVSWTPQPL